MEKRVKPLIVNLYQSSVSCGFPSPADDYLESSLDLNDYLISKPAATFFVRAKGDSMIGAGIFDQDLLVIDRSKTASSGHIILAVINGEFTLKRLIKNQQGTWLAPENPQYKSLQLTEDMDLQIWGVVTYSIHPHLR